MRHTRWGVVLLLMAWVLMGCANPLGSGQETESLSDRTFATAWMARNIDEQGAPLETGTEFSVADARLYVVAEIERLSAGSTLFARWEKEGTPYEDSPLIEAEADLTAGYVHFYLQPEEGEQFETGQYAVTIYVNGEPAIDSRFTVVP